MLNVSQNEVIKTFKVADKANNTNKTHTVHEPLKMPLKRKAVLIVSDSPPPFWDVGNLRALNNSIS